MGIMQKNSLEFVCYTEININHAACYLKKNEGRQL